MPNNYEVETRTALHLAQTKTNKLEAELNATKVKLVQTELAVNELKLYTTLVRLLLRFIGISIIIFDIIKDNLAQENTWQHAPGMGWMQWALLGVGFVILGVGIYRR